MEKMNRRSAVAMALASGVTLTSANASAGNFLQDDEGKPTKDQSYVMGAGMTLEEAQCWSKVAEAAAAFFSLPEQHPLDRAEVTTAIHVMQNKLLSRPTYRKYLELAKAGYEEDQKLKDEQKDDR